MVLAAHGVAQRRHDVLRLVGQHGGRFYQSRLGQEERSIGQSHDEEQSHGGNGQAAEGHAGRNPPAVPAAATMLGEGVSPAASATANGSPPGSAAATA